VTFKKEDVYYNVFSLFDMHYPVIHISSLRKNKLRLTFDIV